MSYARFLEHVGEHTGLRGEALEKATRATVEVLGELIGPARRTSLAEKLPGPLAQALEARAHAPCPDREAFVSRVAASEHVPPGRAVEHATAVLEAFGAELDEDARAVLWAELPEGVREWTEPRREGAPALYRHHPRGSATLGHRLADARPGSAHPVNESAPARGQSGSVAASDDPHGDTKLSEAEGTTQERDHDTLAEGEPESRPISESGD